MTATTKHSALSFYIAATALMLATALPVLAQEDAAEEVEPTPTQAAVTQTGDLPAVTYEMQNAVPVRGDFQVGPTRHIVQLAPGESRIVEIQITNRDGEDNMYQLLAEDFSAGETADDPTRIYGVHDGPYSAKRWLSFGADSVELVHGERAYIPIKITAPADAQAGDHYAAAIVQRKLKDTVTADQGFNVLSRVAALMLITIEGDIVEQGRVTKLETALPLYWSLPSTLRLHGENTGTVHMAPLGSIEIRNIFGILVDEIPITNWVVLRESERIREITWNPKFALGVYTATTNLQLFQQETDPLEVRFWVVPAIPTLIALTVIFLVSYLVQVFFSRFEIKKKEAPTDDE